MSTFQPRPYQGLIIDHIHMHDRCAVWAGMGMGKTVSTLTAVKKFIDEGDGPVLVIAPLRVAQSTWPDECAKWEHLRSIRVSVMTGSPAKRMKALKAKADIYCTNFESIEWLVEKAKPWPFKTIVVDESTRLKSYRSRSGGKRAQALASVAFEAKHFIELTGTPAPNGLIDLWGQMFFLDKGQRLCKTLSAYQQAYFYPVRVGGEAFMVKWLPRMGSEAAIKAKCEDLAIAVNAEDWFDIEQPIVTDLVVTMPDKARSAYDQMQREFIATLASAEVEAVNAVSVLGKCLQLASGAIYTSDDRVAYEVTHSAKIDALRSIVEEAGGAPILVAYAFKHEADRILKEFKGARFLDKDPKTIRDWNEGRIPLLVAHPASCGHGLNLQDGGNILVFFGLGFNYEHYAQMCERIGPTRQAQAGHPRPVFIYRIVSRSTVDNAVLGALEKKKDTLEYILDIRRNADAT